MISDHLSIDRVVLVGLSVRLHVLGRDNTNCEPEGYSLAEARVIIEAWRGTSMR